MSTPRIFIFCALAALSQAGCVRSPNEGRVGKAGPHPQPAAAPAAVQADDPAIACRLTIENESKENWIICQERQCGGARAAGRAYAKAALKPDLHMLPHWRLAASRAWLLAVLSVLQKGAHAEATICLARAVHEMGPYFESSIVMDQQHYGELPLDRIYPEELTIANLTEKIQISDLKNYAEANVILLNKRIYSYVRQHAKSLSETYRVLMKIKRRGNVTARHEVIRILDRPGPLTYIGIPLKAPWPAFGHKFAFDLVDLVEEPDLQQLYEAYEKADSADQFIGILKDFGYQLYGLDETGALVPSR